MSERDSVAVLLKTLDRPAPPRPEFGDALRRRLLTELADSNGHREWVPRLPLPPRHRRSRRLLVAGLAVLLTAAALAAAILSRPSQASALDLIRKAQKQAATLPPFQATVRYDINPDGSKAGEEAVVPKGATETWQVSYAGPKRLRTALTGAHLAIPGARAVGSFDVVNGNNYGYYDRQQKFFGRSTLSPYTRPLGDLAWQGGYPNWEKICRGPAAQVLPAAVIAGRDARHIRCTDATGDVWQLWIDRQTGLLLRLRGQTGGGGDSFLGSVPATSQRGGFTITRLRLHPSFPPGTFKLAAPAGALDYVARLRKAEAKLPPFRALVTTPNGRTQTQERLWWQDSGTWRVDYLAGAGIDGGPGSYEVAAHGRVGQYNAHDNSYGTMPAPKQPNAMPNPIYYLLYENNSQDPSACPIVAHGRIDGRPALQRRCLPDYRIWIDARTGLTLDGNGIRVRNLHYHPTFPARTFHFTRPRGSRSQQQLANDPYYKTTIKRGEAAPNWHAHLLNGQDFQITDLRGKPALLFFFSDGCGAGCIPQNSFASLEHVYQQTKSKLAIVWVDIEGATPAQARKTVRHNHLTFPVVIDDVGNSEHAWKYQAYPYWVLLDPHGRAIEARLKPQTVSQLQTLIKAAK